MLNNLRICVQKFLPEHRHIIDQVYNSNKVAAAFYKNKLWEPQSEIFIVFLDDGKNIPRNTVSGDVDPLQTYFEKNQNITIPEAVKKIVMERIQPLVNLKFTFIEKSEIADKKNVVKISFDPDGGAWSLVGKDAINQKGPTMNLGWFDVSTVLHEFGHVLGMIHEHQSPLGKSIDWNQNEVFKWARETQGWNEEETKKNILDKYNKNMINGSDFDPLSVMLYFFPAKLTMNHRGTKQNLRLSADDVIWIEKTYPGGSMSAKEYYPKVYGISLDKALKQEEMARNPKTLHIIVITIIILGLFLLFGLFMLKLRKHKK
jgi:hypothetical protein